MNQAARLVTIEGADGCGKTSLAVSLTGALRAAGYTVLLTREPGGTPGAEAIRRLLLDPPDDIVWSPWSQAMLFSAARRDHVEKTIAPALARGEWVVCDRFVDSMHVYQAEVEASARAALEKAAVAGHRPDLTFILDMPPRRADMLARQLDMFATVPEADGWNKGGKRDAMERTTSHRVESLRAAFLSLARTDQRRYRVLDARPGAEAVLAEALSVLREVFTISGLPTDRTGGAIER